MPDVPLHVNGDTVRLQQIQSNLLNNAIKYSSEGSCVRLELTSDSDSAVIRVVDQGAGIASELLESMFDMFVQSDNTLDRSQGGMGVGLTLVRELVERHGGSISARSDGIGHGSQFEVRLPLVDLEDSTETMKPVIAREPQELKSIVIIEDQEDNRAMLAGLLRIEGFQVQCAADGLSGIQLIIREQPDAAIVDIGLPVQRPFFRENLSPGYFRVLLFVEMA